MAARDNDVRRQKEETMETQDQDNRAHVTIDISPEIYEHIETAAAQNNLLIKEYIEKLLEQIVLHNTDTSQQERTPMTREAFEAILRFREQIKQDRQGRPFDDSTEIIRQMREERSQYLASLWGRKWNNGDA